MKAIFITGTDTGVGKTVFTGLLARYLLERGYNAVTQKWIQTGSKGFPKDIAVHLKLMKRKRSEVRDCMQHITPYKFKFPSSPHLAAQLEKKIIKKDKIKKSFRYLMKRFDFVIVEGIGGALVPINKKEFVIDIAKELKVPVLIVVDNKLGAINQTLLTIEAIRRRRMEITGIIFNNRSKGTDKRILKDNIRIIKNISGEKVMGVF
ncbi:MAG: dethiobiotin synthase [Candidatus Omnitrophica bacterium]|nr:dethiobiotin synthase [Candidatus Omnitrophota bacterium]